jgi:thioredoxin 1
MSKVIEVGEADFARAVLASDVPALVNFTTATCGSCILLAAVLKDIVPDYGDEIKFVKVDVEKWPEAAKAYDIRSVPTVLLFRDGEARQRLLGNQSRSKLTETLDTFLADGE